MRRYIALVPTVIAAAILLLPAVASARRARAPARQGASEASAAFALRATNGLSGQVSTTGKFVELLLFGHRQFVIYGVSGRVSERGVEARFGKRGRISVEFRPDGPHSAAKAAGECVGRKSQSGVFVGTIRFRGERDYTSIHATRARGCLRVHGAMNRLLSGTPGAGASGEEEREVATLTAEAGRRLFRVAGFREPDGSGEAFYSAGAIERREGMQIARVALVDARVSSFSFDHTAGTATVSPPKPFSGSATFEKHPDGSKAWTGTLSVSLLGIDPVALTGPGFKLSLRPEFDD